MGFKLNQIIIHNLLKEQHIDFDPIKPYILRDVTLDPENEIVISTIRRLMDLYGSKYNTATYGIFSHDKCRRGQFPDKFRKYCLLDNSSNNKSKDFIELSKIAMKELKNEASKSTASSGGFVVFADYNTTSTTRYLLIAMIKQKDSVILSEALDLDSLLSLDLSKIHQAFRINFSDYTKQENQLANYEDKSDKNYLSFVSPSTNRGTSGYFVTALGCNKNSSAAKMTSNVIITCLAFFSDKQLTPQKEAFKDDLVNYLADCHKNKKPATLATIGNIANKYIVRVGDEAFVEEKNNELIKQLNSDKLCISSEFNVNGAALNKVLKVSYASKDKDLSFNFLYSMLGTDESASIYFDQNNEKLTFNCLDEKAIETLKKAVENSNNNNGENENELKATD